MPPYPAAQSTRRFMESAPVVTTIALASIVIAGLYSLTSQRTVLRETVAVSSGVPATLGPVQLENRPIGAVRVDVSAVLPTNRWVTYEVLLLDAQGNTIASAIKQAWRESGTWVEDGESGTWEEKDLKGGIDVRATGQQAEPVTIAIATMAAGDVAGLSVTEPVSFRVEVRTGAIDGRYLWVGFFATLALTALTHVATGQTGRVVIRKAINDSDLGGRGVMGGADTLIKATIHTTMDETLPSQFYIDLYVKDGNGEEIYYKRTSFKRGLAASEDVYKQTLDAYFVLKPKKSYGFYVEVVPDGPVDRTQLIVKENVRTRGPVSVVELTAI